MDERASKMVDDMLAKKQQKGRAGSRLRDISLADMDKDLMEETNTK